MLSPWSILKIGLCVGVLSGFGALLFYELLKLLGSFALSFLFGYAYPEEGMALEEAAAWAAPQYLWLIIPILCAGAFLSSLLVQKTAPETKGAGTNNAIKAFHDDGKIRWRVPFVKIAASVLTIGTGGSAGCEGPITQVCAGFGAIVSDLFHFSEKERKMAIAAGIGAGIGAIFKAPFGGAVLGAEILYLKGFDFEALIPSLIASMISFLVFGFFEGYDALFCTLEFVFTLTEIPLFAVFGAVAALIGLLYIFCFYKTQTIFAKIHLPELFKPVLGVLIFGIIVVVFGLISPQTAAAALGTLGTGYGFVQLALYNLLPFAVLLILPFLKILGTSLTIGSGASGGVFAPGLSIGAFAGGAFGAGLVFFFPDVFSPLIVPAFVIVGMIALFGSISHAPVAVLIMVMEMTRSVSLVIPAALALIAACLIVRKKTLFSQQREKNGKKEAE
ncbi:MAG TPA: chloride channel protein [Methanocorpusculum sp.]|nr:chloride channel protein [Methanocorpusculum sp.]